MVEAVEVVPTEAVVVNFVAVMEATVETCDLVCASVKMEEVVEMTKLEVVGVLPLVC